MAPHVQRVFGASPSAVGKLLFFGAVYLPRTRPFLVLFLVPCGLYLAFSFFSPGILARSAPSRNSSFNSLLFLYSSSSPCTPGPSISSPTVPQYLKE